MSELSSGRAVDVMRPHLFALEGKPRFSSLCLFLSSSSVPPMSFLSLLRSFDVLSLPLSAHRTSFSFPSLSSTPLLSPSRSLSFSHGFPTAYGMCAAALLSSVPACPLGVPDSLKKFAFKAAKTFLLAPQPPASPLADEIATVRSSSHPSRPPSVALCIFSFDCKAE